ncbi:MAG: hypothetical protein GX275_10990 [Clostridiales bacterium]|nr:hypothetical protein [Clostridiales bacterium]
MKKIISGIIIATTLMTTITIAKPFVNIHGSTINAGLVAPGNNYYMSYCYMYDGTTTHWAQAKLGGKLGNYAKVYGAGTACSNSPSLYKTTNWTYNYGYN